MEAQTRRKLLDGAAYNGLITATAHRDTLIQKQAGVPDTLKLVARVATEYRQEVAKLTTKLAVYGPGGMLDLAATCRAIWKFVYQHIQYHLDEPGLEQVRHPARSWADRERGVDCEDYTVFISALLQNLEVPHLLRISAYKGGWQHIYVVVPKVAANQPAGDVYEENYIKPKPDLPRLRRADYITLDCVTDEYDFEVTPSKTMNYPMPRLMELSGLPDDLPLPPAAPVPQLVVTYPSASGHTLAVSELGTLYVREDEGMGELGELGAIGRFKPFAEAQKRLAGKGKRVSKQVKRGGLIKKLVGKGGYFLNPADVPGANHIAATWITESNHLAGISHTGDLYVMDTNDRLGELAGLAGLDPNDPELAGWLKNAFKKVGKVAQSAGNIAKKVGSGIANGVQKGVFDNLNKIPGVKYLADNYGMEILQTAAGVGLTALTGGAAAPALLALKAGKAASIAAKVAKVASVTKKAKTALSAAKKVSKVAKLVNTVKKVQKVVKVAKKVSALIPRGAMVGAAQSLSDNPQPLSFMPAEPDQVQDYSGGRVLNLVRQVAAPAEQEYEGGPTLPLTPETSYGAAEQGYAVRSTSSVMAPEAETEDYAAADAGTYAQEFTSDEPDYEAGGDMQVAEYASTDEEVGALPINLNSTTVLLVGGGLLAAGLVALAMSDSGSGSSSRRSSGLSGTGRPQRRASTTKAGGTGRKATTKKGVTQRGKVRVIRL